MDPTSLLTALGEAYITDFLRAKGGAMLQRWHNVRAERPRILYESAYGMLRAASHNQLSAASEVLLRYYSDSIGVGPQDACFPRYTHDTLTSVHLPLVSQFSLVNAVKTGLTVTESYVSPQSRPLPMQMVESWPPFRKRLDLNFTDGDIFNLRSYRLEGDHLHLDFTESKFLPWRDTYGDLQDEFIMQLPLIFKEGSNARPIFTLRNRLLPNLDSLFDIENRYSAGGVVVLTVLPHMDGDAEILVEPRSSEVTDGQSLLTTIPRAFHDSFAKARGDYSLETTILREVVEEIFGMYPKRNGQTSTKAYLQSCEAVAELISQRTFVLHPTGVMFDLLKGNYTFTYLMLITDPTWWPRYQGQQKLNSEFQIEGQGSSFSLSWIEEIAELIARPDWTFEGYYAFTEGIRALPLIARRHQMNHSMISHAEAACTVLPDLTWVPAQQFRQ